MEVEPNREEEEESQVQAEVDIWKYVFGFVDVAVVKCAIELGIPDALETSKSPTTLSNLSSSLGCSPSALHRIMRFLVNRKIFKESPNGYLQTPLSRLLAKNVEQNRADLLLFESSPVMLAPWHGLSACVRSKESTAFESTHGGDIWRYGMLNPVHSKFINNAMSCHARVVVPAVIEGCPELFDDVESVVDVGGGDGTALRLLIKAFPWLRCINLDLPHVVLDAPADCVEVEQVGGDMFVSVPNADAAYLMCVLHDWDDNKCIQILRKCREAIPKEKGKVIIVEAVVEEGEKGGNNKNKLEYVRLMMDMVVMAHTNNGKQRTSKEWAYVLKESGFRRHTIKPIKAVQYVIEAYP